MGGSVGTSPPPPRPPLPDCRLAGAAGSAACRLPPSSPSPTGGQLHTGGVVGRGRLPHTALGQTGGNSLPCPPLTMGCPRCLAAPGGTLVPRQPLLSLRRVTAHSPSAASVTERSHLLLVSHQPRHWGGERTTDMCNNATLPCDTVPHCHVTQCHTAMSHRNMTHNHTETRHTAPQPN